MNSPISRKPVTRITAIAEKTHDGRAHNSSNGGPYRGGGLIFTALLHLSLPSRLGVPTKSWNHLARVGTLLLIGFHGLTQSLKRTSRLLGTLGKTTTATQPLAR